MTPLEFCEKYWIKNYTINSDDTIDVNGDVDILGLSIETIPVKFRNVSGCFDCSFNMISEIAQVPLYVGESFDCSWCKITTLENGPKYVGGNFCCYGNKLTTLEGCPEYVGGGFYCYENKLSSLEGCPKYIGDDFSSDIITHHILGNVQCDIYCNIKQRIII